MTDAGQPANPELRLVLWACLAEALAMSGFAAYPALLPVLRQAWQMSGTQAGLVGGAFFFGYMLAVPLLSGLTDRVDARRVFATSCALAAAGSIGFGLLAQGVVSGLLCQALTGAGLAGTYMPGLKALTDRLRGPSQARYVSFYTATFGVGASLSLLLAGWLNQALGWQTSFLILGLLPLLAMPIMLRRLQALRPASRTGSVWPRFGPVWSQPAVRRFIIGYTVHCWELLGLRAWQVAFFSFAFGAGSLHAWLSPTEAAALLNLLGLPASIVGNELAMRLGRQRWIAAAMLSSGLLCWLAGASALAPWFVTLAVMAVYNVGVMADSASLTAGLIAHSDPTQRGTVMALYSLAGFGAGFVAPVVFGAVLDASGGTQSPLAWTLAMGVLGLGCLFWGWRMQRQPAPGG